MKKNVFIGGAWPYGNYNLHVGHLAALLPGDIIARCCRQMGDQVIYVSGTDCHGTPITERARREGLSPAEIAKRYHSEDISDFRDLRFSYDNYGATYEPEHQRQVQELFLRLYANGFLRETDSFQAYCENCGKFLADREIAGRCPVCGADARGDQCDHCLSSFDPQSLGQKHCLICGEPVTEKPRRELVFLLSSFQHQLENYFEESKGLWRPNAVNETRKYLAQGLPDRDASRSLCWGIPIPFEGYEDQRIYVWFEAVLGYLTSGRTAARKMAMDFDAFLRDTTNLETYFVHGKDNIPFHTVIYPALILGLDLGYQLPRHVISSEYVNMDGEKMSKSKGNLVTVRELLSQYPSDSIRLYFALNNPEKKDLNFTPGDLAAVHNKFLVGGFGNFVNRNLSFLKKKFDGILPAGTVDPSVYRMTDSLYTVLGAQIRDGEIRAAAEEITRYIQAANKYYDEQKPWIQVRENLPAFGDTTATCLFIMANMTNLFAPVIPDGCDILRNILHLPKVPCWRPIFPPKDLILGECPILYQRI